MTAIGAASTARAEPPAELVARFKAALERLWPHGHLGLAVSGGPDSLAMLLLAEAAIPGQFEVATVDHGLRAESAGECAMVARVCAERSIPCRVLSVEVGVGNLQAQARAARYEALMDWAEASDILAVMTAHHADDQAETLLMRLNRGSGVAGLAGVRGLTYIGDRVSALVRPLLGFRRAELAEIVERSGLTAVTDPSNVDDRFDRARVRKAIAESDWLDPISLATSAANLAHADEAIAWAASREWFEQVTGEMPNIRYRHGAPWEVMMRVVARIIELYGDAPRGSDIARLIERLRARENGSLGGAVATVEGDDWVFRPEPPRRTG